jgi:hypothetical protein
MVITERRAGATAAGPDADPLAVAAAALADLLAAADRAPADIPLVVIGLADPGTGPGARSTPLLDGNVPVDAARRLLLDNGLVGAVPVGVCLDADRLAETAHDCAASLLLAERLPVVLLVTVCRAGGGLVATAAELSADTFDI